MAGQEDNKCHGEGDVSDDTVDPTDSEQTQTTDVNFTEEYDFLDSKLDELNSALDFLEKKNDDIHERLKELLQSSRDIRQQLRSENMEVDLNN
ncbi:UPF0184 protein AAEL002161-like [Pectinophora gossypiella]|uniref:UPF0184 protein AAEL002161-like n=1 Tax=Pectinophora gossypiella TaxID=13191 RepID=UPI00214F4248|nr:UPF0184 protein AAEL002161-like [Pectinophora gossypiella]